MAADRREMIDVEISPNGMPGSLRLPKEPQSALAFANGSGSSRHRKPAALATLSGPKKRRSFPAQRICSRYWAVSADRFDAYSVRMGQEQ